MAVHHENLTVGLVSICSIAYSFAPIWPDLSAYPELPEIGGDARTSFCAGAPAHLNHSGNVRTGSMPAMLAQPGAVTGQDDGSARGACRFHLAGQLHGPQSSDEVVIGIALTTN